jgi:hypothetical protein
VNQTWVKRARQELFEFQARAGVWSYRRGGAPGVEPTALACLGLLATSAQGSAIRERATRRAAAGWIADLQRGDGSVPATSDPALPGWATAHALLVWRGLPSFEPHRQRARDWLLGRKGRPIPTTPENRGVIGHDTSLIGWPWVEGTHSWLEPTALAILALAGERLGDHPRVRDGVRLILDRAIPSGGWNYGNKAVFGRMLRPQPAPTGLALLALAGRADGQASPAVARALDYLRGTLPAVRAAVSLGWGVLGLRAHGSCPAQAQSWLAEAYAHCTGRPDAILGLAALLLAAGDGDLSCVGQASA